MRKIMFKFIRKKIAERADEILSTMPDDWSRLNYYLERYGKTGKQRHLNICNYLKEIMGLG